LNKLGLETLISSRDSHEIELLGDEPTKKSKIIVLKSKGKYDKGLQAVESEEEAPSEDSEESSDVEEITFFTKRL